MIDENQARHFTAIKGAHGWEVYNGEPENRGERATYNSFTHSDSVFDYVERVGRAMGKQTQLHFDLRGIDQ